MGGVRLLGNSLSTSVNPAGYTRATGRVRTSVVMRKWLIVTRMDDENFILALSTMPTAHRSESEQGYTDIVCFKTFACRLVFVS